MDQPLRPLTVRERIFVEHYLTGLSGFQAALRAGYTRRSACEAWRIRRRPSVAAAIEKAMAARSRRVGITADRVLREYARIAFADIRNFATSEDKGRTLKVTSLDDLSEDDAAAVAEMTGEPGGKGAKVKLHDKKRALDAIARHLGFFDKDRDSTESPSAAAERARDLIRSRLAELARRKQQR